MMMEGCVMCAHVYGCMCSLVHDCVFVAVCVCVLCVLHWLPKKCFTLALSMSSGLQANVPFGMLS